jgi:hypothetical protein
MGRFSGIGAAIANVADKLRKEREMGQEFGQKANLLGIEGLMTGRIAPAAEGETGTTFDLPMGKFKPVKELKEWKPTSKEEAIEFEKEKYGARKAGSSVKVIGNSLVKYDPITGEANPIYTAPASSKLFKDPLGGVWEYDNTGRKQKIINEFGELVETISASQSPIVAPTEERVNIISPTGQKGTIPKSQLQDALKSGYKRLP